MSGATCYYPNGNESPSDIPCGGGDGVACCPQGWSCEPNGLCHLAEPFYYGRYTCTDKTWSSKGCPNICTHDNTAPGAEAVLECSSGQYCCDANRPELSPDNSIDQSKDCCHTSSDRFPLAQLPLAPGGAEGAEGSGGSGGSGGSAASSSSSSSASPSAAQTSSSSSSASSSSSSTSSSASSSNNASPTLPSVTLDTSTRSSSDTHAAASIITSVITKGTGGSSTLVTTTSGIGTAAPASASQASSPTPAPASGSNKLGPIIGPAVAVPVAVLLLAALAFVLFRRRRRQKQTRASSPPPMEDKTQPMYGSDGKDLVDSPYTGKSELEGSPNMSKIPPGTPGDGTGDGYHTPNDVGVGGLRDPRSELAASNSTAARTPRSRLSELQGSPPTVHETDAEAQAAELPGNETQSKSNTYKPYRPPGLGLTE